MLAMIGAAALVPPTVPQPLKHLPPSALRLEQLESYTDTPVFGSATAETSATVRLAHPLSVCQGGLASYFEQPLPAPFHTVSFHPRGLLSRLSVVPPTAVTYGDAAGYSTP